MELFSVCVELLLKPGLPSTKDEAEMLFSWSATDPTVLFGTVLRVAFWGGPDSSDFFEAVGCLYPTPPTPCTFKSLSKALKDGEKKEIKLGNEYSKPGEIEDNHVIVKLNDF